MKARKLRPGVHDGYAVAMEVEFFRLEHAPSGIAHLQLSRPEQMNTLAPPFFPALREAVEQMNGEGQTRVLVLSSTGKHFSAGMALDVFAGSSDLASMLNTASARSRLAFQGGIRQLMRCFDVLEDAHFPVIAAIQGGCIGGALDLAAACDIRVCTADAFFTVQEIHIGMAADLGVLQRLPKIIPPGVAREMAFTGERVGAERALATGLVNAVLPDARALLDHAMKLAESIAAKSPLAIAGTKKALNYAVDHPVADALEQMTLLQSAIFDIGEMGKAIAAWKAKGAGQFDPLDPQKRLSPAS